MGSKTLSKWKSILPRQMDWIFILSSIAIVAGFILTLVSSMRVCTSACSQAHSYRLLNLPFETLGIIFFIVVSVLHVLSLKFVFLTTLIGWILACALGSEIMFLYIQKYKIGSWCPVCVSIATSIAVVASLYFFRYCKNCATDFEHGNKDQTMKNMFRGLSGILFMMVGFFIAFFGITKENKLQAQENTLKETIAFGNLSSPIEIYVFTDWECPACRSIEPLLKKIAPKIMKNAKLTFVDYPIHAGTLNFTPYNLSFMVNNKDKYFELRNALSDLSLKTTTPTDSQVEKIAQNAGAQYHQLNYSDVALGINYFKQLQKQLKIEGTPSIAIINMKNKKGKKLSGAKEITVDNITKAIDSLNKK